MRSACETCVARHLISLSKDIRSFTEYDEEEDPTNRSFFSEIISSISDVKFSHDGRYILARDYLSLRIWDVNMESRPLKTIQIHDHLRGKLCDLYENDCIFDKFECTWSGDDKWARSLLISDSEMEFLFQECADWFLPQLLAHLRRGDSKRRCIASGQVCIQSEENWRTITG